MRKVLQYDLVQCDTAQHAHPFQAVLIDQSGDCYKLAAFQRLQRKGWLLEALHLKGYIGWIDIPKQDMIEITTVKRAQEAVADASRGRFKANQLADCYLVGSNGFSCPHLCRIRGAKSTGTIVAQFPRGDHIALSSDCFSQPRAFEDKSWWNYLVRYER